MNDFTTATLGVTGLSVGRLGVAGSYGAPPAAYEMAFERGCNYFSLGSGRHRAAMRSAIRNLCRGGRRDRLVISLHTYARRGSLLGLTFPATLKKLGIEHADVLVLGWHNRPPSRRLMDTALSLREQGLVRFVGMSGHNRQTFGRLATGELDLFHVRYNAAHRGAEQEVFPLLTGEKRPGIVTYTATRWAHLLNPRKMPQGEGPASATDCYRFVLSNASVDVCLCGPRDRSQMETALTTLELGPLDGETMTRMKKIGDHLHQKKGGFF